MVVVANSAIARKQRDPARRVGSAALKQHYDLNMDLLLLMLCEQAVLLVSLMLLMGAPLRQLATMVSQESLGVSVELSRQPAATYFGLERAALLAYAKP